jgi:hypothetical protein
LSLAELVLALPPALSHIKKSGMITSAIQQIVNTDRAELKNFFSEVDKLHKTDEAVTAKIANNPALAYLRCSVGWCQYLGLGCLSHGWFHVLGWLPNLWCY